MDWLVYLGAAVALGGLAGLGWCITEARRLRANPEPTEEGARRRIGRIIAVNMAAVGLGFLGLALVVAGMIL